MKVPVNSIRAGNVIEYNGKLWVASKVQHINPGKGGAFVAIEAKALREGNKLQERFRSGETIERVHIDERDCTYLFGTGTFLGYYARHANPVDFGSVRYVISGGEKLGEEVARAWQEKFGLRIYDGYGATECAPVISLATPQSFRPGAVGRLLPGMEQRIAPVPGIERGGVLHVRGPNVMLGYYRYDRPGVIDPVCSAFGAGWYDTGDVVEIDDEGFITIVGRVKRFVKVAGEMVPLDAIEEVARRASPAALHAAVMCTEAAGGETSVLFTTDPGLTRAALLQAARDLGLQDLAAARRVVWLHEIPLLGNGKTDYVTLQARARTLDAAAMASGHAEDRGLRGVPAAAVSIISRES